MDVGMVEGVEMEFCNPWVSVVRALFFKNIKGFYFISISQLFFSIYLIG